MERLHEMVRAAQAACMERSASLQTKEVQTFLENSQAVLDSADPWLGYHYVPTVINRFWREISEREGESAAADFLRLLIVRYVEQFDRRFQKSEIPPLLISEFERLFERMLTTIADASFDADPDSHVFLKDLAISRLRLIPCVSHVVYRYSGIPRRTLVMQPPRRLPEIVSFILRARGFRPFLENHVHPAMLDQFNASGRARCYSLIAELLKAWPDSKGLMGASWYYDPELAHISPNLEYLYRVPLNAGALVLCIGEEGEESGALARSKRRRELYRMNAYVPTTHLMIWARKDILRYVANERD